MSILCLPPALPPELWQIACSPLPAPAWLFPVLALRFYLYQMDLNSFRDSLASSNPPSTLSVYAQALWYDAKGNWHRSHELIQDLTDKNAAWIHAYLHRKEGDIWNADYWYTRAGRKRPNASLQEEWEQIAGALL